MKNIVSQFAIENEIAEIRPLGNGLINDTYLVRTADPAAADYVLQRINHKIFTDVEGLQRNIRIVTDHLRSKLQAAGTPDLDRRVLSFVPLKADPEKTYYFDGESYWRISRYITDSHTVDTVSPQYAEYAGEAFGRFQADLVDVPAEQLIETIPDFHNLSFRIQQLRDAIRLDSAGRLAETRDIADRLLDLAPQMTLADRLHSEGRLPKRICHCDTKVNNMLFDSEGNVLCVIDLDTVMPSFVFSDFGDFLRTAANPVAEDCPDLDKIGFRLDIFEAFTRGYLRSAGQFLTETEVENLPYAAALFPYMQAVRFYVDYLQGDTYYKIQYPDHNLVRTRAQLRLFDCVIAALPQMKEIVGKCR